MTDQELLELAADSIRRRDDLPAQRKEDALRRLDDWLRLGRFSLRSSSPLAERMERLNAERAALNEALQAFWKQHPPK